MPLQENEMIHKIYCNEVKYDKRLYLYKLIVYSNLSITKIPLIAKKNRVYCINIGGNNLNNRKHLVTIILMDKYNPNIKIKGGEMIIWQDIQSQ